MSLPPERRRHLQELGLRALVKRRFGDAVAQDLTRVKFGAGAAVIADSFAAVFADSPAGLGSAIDTAHREGVDRLYFFSELNTGAVARRAHEFALDTTVVQPDGDFEPVDPEPVRDDDDTVPPALDAAADRLRGAGLTVIVEHGIVLGEWRGLEVARATIGNGLEIGVGKHDREGHLLLSPEGPTDAALLAARSVVEGLRRPGAPPHPANQLVPDRWLRDVLIRHPDLVDAGDLQPMSPPEPRTDLRQRGIAPAWGRDRQGRPVVVVASVGVDPDVVPQAADARLHAPLPGEDARLIIAVPEGDDHPLTRRLVELLERPAEIIGIRGDWKSLG